MFTPRAGAHRIVHAVVLEPRALAVLTAAYIAAGVVFVQTDYTLNNEGILTHYWASWASRDFLPVFFFQKVKPVLCALYAAVAPYGAHATLIAHTIVAAMAMLMAASTARALGQRFPNVAAFVIALSPVYLYGGPAGLSNVDGVVGIVLALYLLCAHRQAFAAGLVLGLLPWVRFELTLFCLVMGIYALVTPDDRRMLLGMVVFPLAYIISGALYHQDVLWLAHYPPSAPFDPDNPIYRGQLVGLRYLLEPMAAITPVAPLAVIVPWERLHRVERALVAYVIATVLAMNFLAILRVGNFGGAPRYELLILPALALLIGRALEPLWEGQRPGVNAVAATALVAVWVATRQQDASTIYLLIGAYAVLLAAATLRVRALAVGLTALLILAGPLLAVRSEVTRETTAKYLDPIFAWLQAHPEARARPIYTNAQLLAPFVEPRLAVADIYHVAGIDMVRELVMLTNPHNGQRDRIRRLCETDLYGKTVFAPIAPEDLPRDALFALRVDERLPLLLPAPVWSGRLEVLAETADYRIAQLRPAATVTARP